MTHDELTKVNSTLKTTDIKGKDYVEVNERVKAFRKLYPEGTIATELISNTGESGKQVCVFKASVYNGATLLATGHAYENEGSSFINKTSYIENCETSAIGRALGFVGIGIDTSIASYEEVANAKANSPKTEPKSEAKPKSETKPKLETKPNGEKATVFQVAYLCEKYKGKDMEKLLKKNNIEQIEDLPLVEASRLITLIKEMEKNESINDTEENAK